MSNNKYNQQDMYTDLFMYMCKTIINKKAMSLRGANRLSIRGVIEGCGNDVNIVHIRAILK